MLINDRKPIALLLALLGALAGLSASCSVAGAALEPGTPVDVAPGVPSHGRAWELVTMPDPNPTILRTVFAVSRDGNRVFYVTVGQLPDSPVGLPIFPGALATRGPNGWSNASVPSPHPDLDSTIEYPGLWQLDPDLESSVWTSTLPSEETGLFRRAADGQYTLLAAGAKFVDASTDLLHVVFASEKHLLAADGSRTSGQSLYELVGSDLRLVDVDAAGSPLSDCGSSGGGLNSSSRDGQRIFFTTHPSCAGPARVYLRAGGTATTEISASQCDLPDCGPESDVAFAGASPGGSSAFLRTGQRLTDADSNSHQDLYRYQVGSGQLTLLSADPGGPELVPTAESVHLSNDGARVYFGASEETGPGQLGEPRLFLSEDGGVPRLVPGAHPGQFVQVSGDGRYALFATVAQLDPTDSDAALDAYRYDAETDAATRISVGSSGGNGPFDASLEVGEAYPTKVLVNQPFLAMSEDAGRIFFTTNEQLLPEDRNQVSDVYEWAHGDLGLISSGAAESVGETYAGATPDGRTALLASRDVLLPSDRDGGDIDVYAARIGGGFPESAPAPGCEGACSVAPRERIERGEPRSAGRGARGIRVARIDAAARRQIVATGWIELLAEVPERGRLGAEARARIGDASRIVAATSVKVAQGGPTRLRMGLSKGARRQLGSGHGLHLHVFLRLADLRRGIGIELEDRR
jgi:hypothetical protein